MSSVSNIYSKTCQWYNKNLSVGERETITFIVGYSLTPLDTFIHEQGHAVMLRILFSNANPQIVLKSFGFNGGGCSFGFLNSDRAILSPIGEVLGKSTSFAMVSAAGPMADIIRIAMAFFCFPRQAGPLMLPSSVQVGIYALSALDQLNCSSSHDYCLLKKQGGSWAYAALALPAITTLACCAFYTIRRWSLVSHSGDKTEGISKRITRNIGNKIDDLDRRLQKRFPGYLVIIIGLIFITTLFRP